MIKKNHPSLQCFIKFWSHYGQLEAFHTQWIRRHAECLSIRRGDILYWRDDGDGQQYIYFVCKGKIARIRTDDKSSKRHILSIALSGSALMTTTHLHSSTPSEGEIIALSASTVIRIPYAAIKDFEEQEPLVGRLIRVLDSKKKRQLVYLRNITHSTDALERYFLFDEKMPNIRFATSQQEQADLLGISKSSVQKAQKLLLKSKK